MAAKTTIQSPESLRLEAETNQKEKIILHLFCAPVALLLLIGAFTYQCVLIPTVGQLAFCIIVIAISIFILKRSGRALLHSFKQQSDGQSSGYISCIKSFLSHYFLILFIAVVTISIGLLLNVCFPDLNKQEKQIKEIEQLFGINPNMENR